jgi:hypothetical protein
MPQCPDPSPPQPSKDDPNSIPDYVITRLTKLRKKASAAAFTEICGVLRGPTLESDENARAFLAALELLVHALDRATIDSTPATPEPDGLHAHKLYTLRSPDGITRQFLLRLYSDPNHPAWWLEEIIPLDTG